MRKSPPHPIMQSSHSLLTIELLGGLRLRQADNVVTHFRTQKTASLLAFLAFYLHRSHPREELIELLWPESDPDAGRTSLRSALTALRRQLEPQGAAETSILQADRQFVRLDPASVTTDVLAFESAIQAAEAEADAAKRRTELEQALRLYRGPLLPGFYEDWALDERERLQRRFGGALRDLAAALEETGDLRRAIEIAHRVVSADPFVEESQMNLVRLYAMAGQINAATRQFREMERLLRREMNAQPSARARAELDDLLKRAAAGEFEARTPIPPSPADEAESVAPVPAEDAAPLPETEAAEPAPLTTESTESTTPNPVAKPHVPAQFTPFIGREEEIESIRSLLTEETKRIVTLTGMAGSGKTRLAVEAGQTLAGAFGGGVWFVPLADVADEQLIPDTIARALGMDPGSGGETIEQIGRALGEGRVLLILDNFEQLAESGTPLLLRLLERSPGLTLLITSRQRLDVGGEAEFAVQPLPIPEAPALPEQLERYAGVRLFVDRARASRPGFQLTRDNAAAVAALCEQLEGLPLALELAAAWASTLTPAQMLARLSQRFDLLTSRRRDLPPRHRTLRAAVEWSDRLLEPELRAFFARLSVFRGGFTLEAAESVCGEPDALTALLQLRERSLVVAEEAGSAMRYRLLETLREYGAEQVPPEERERLAASHARYFAGLAEAGGERLRGPERLRWLAALEPEQDNFRAALATCVRSRNIETGLRIAAALAPFWAGAGYAREGLARLEELLALRESRAEADDRLRGRALLGAALLAELAGSTGRLVELLEECRRVHARLGDKAAAALATGRMHHPIYHETRDTERAVAMLDEALALAEESGSEPAIAETLWSMGNMARDGGETEKAGGLYQRALALYRRLGDQVGVSGVLGDMGYMYTATGEFELAEAACAENLTLCRELRNKVSTAHALWLLGRVAEARDDLPRARTLLEEAVVISRESGHRQEYYNAEFQLALVAEREGRFAEAREVYLRCMDIAKERESPRGVLVSVYAVARVSASLGDSGTARDYAARLMEMQADVESPRGVAGTLSTLARVALREGNPRVAAALLGAADRHHREVQPLVHLSLWDHQRASEEARAALGEAAFEAVRLAGESLTTGDALRLGADPALPADLLPAP